MAKNPVRFACHIRRLVNDKIERERLSNNAHELIKNEFSYEKCLSQLAKVIEKKLNVPSQLV